jgi:hypothetical protein
VEDRLSEHEDKIEIKEKTEEKTQDMWKEYAFLTDYIKKPNLTIMGIEEVEEVQAKGFIIY